MYDSGVLFGYQRNFINFFDIGHLTDAEFKKLYKLFMDAFSPTIKNMERLYATEKLTEVLKCVRHRNLESFEKACEYMIMINNIYVKSVGNTPPRYENERKLRGDRILPIISPFSHSKKMLALPANESAILKPTSRLYERELAMKLLQNLCKYVNGDISKYDIERVTLKIFDTLFELVDDEADLGDTDTEDNDDEDIRGGKRIRSSKKRRRTRRRR